MTHTSGQSAQSNACIGACRLPSGEVQFRVWAPGHRTVELALGGSDRLEMSPEHAGYWALTVASLPEGARYGFVLDGDTKVLPDPASRFQPEGPHGLSEIIDPTHFVWTDAAWSGVQLAGQVIYEIHIGTFTSEGTWDAARAKLPELAALGVSVIEVMPVAAFRGRFGWGYDGVDLYAPHHPYGRPDELRRFVDAAHGFGLGVILDVVYNHVGPDGDYLPAFSASYFSKLATEWGAAFNYDGEDSRAVRDFIAGNAEYWIREFHFDGLRLDATQSIFDTSSEHIITEISRRTRAAAGACSIILVAENEPQHTHLVRAPERGGYGLDALWNDDLHHSAMVALLGHREAYYTDYLGRAHEFVAAMKHGYLYQGQRYAWQDQRRGTPAFDLSPRTFVTFLENHDQVANTPRGERLRYRAQPAAYRAMTAMWLLGPWTPMLFQGQEWASERSFTYFADFEGKLAENVQRGRYESLTQFPSYASSPVQEAIPEPGAPSSFEDSKLDWAAGVATAVGQQTLALHRDLLALRREDPVLRACIASAQRKFEAAVLTDHALVLRYFGEDGDDRLIVINLDRGVDLVPAPEPLLAPPSAASWRLIWSSEQTRYGGYGVPEGLTDARGWRLPAQSALLFTPGAREATPETPTREGQAV